MYAIITVLSNKEGYCFASNAYLGNLLKAQPHTISKWVSHLKELGFVCLDIIKNDKGEIIQRRIYPNDVPYAINRTYPYSINETEGMSQKGQYNNISNNIINNNMIDRFFLYIRNKDEKVPKEFSRIDKMKILEILYKYEMLYTDEMLQYMQEENVQKIKEITYTLALIVKENLEQSIYKIKREKLIQLYNECKTLELEYKGTENEIDGFVNYYYKSIKNEMVKNNNQSFFMPKNKQKANRIIEDDEKGAEL